MMYLELASTMIRAYCIPDQVAMDIGPVRSTAKSSIFSYLVLLIFRNGSQCDFPKVPPSQTWSKLLSPDRVSLWTNLLLASFLTTLWCRWPRHQCQRHRL